MIKLSKKPSRKKPKPKLADAPPGVTPAALPPNPLVTMANMAKSVFGGTVGRLPTPLVIIATVSLLAAVLVGLGLQMATRKEPLPVNDPVRFLPLRLEVDPARQISPEAVNGIWVTPKGELSMTIRFNNGMFEWIIQPPNSQYQRNFIRGNYRVEGDVLILAQRPDMGKPVVPAGQVLDYLPISMKNINARMQIGSQMMLWTVPEGEVKLQNPVFTQILPASEAKKLAWVKIQ